MNLASFKFVIIDAPGLTVVRGPAVYDKAGKRIGQLIVELVDGHQDVAHQRTFPDSLVAELRITPEGAVSVVNPQGTEETGTDRPAAPQC